MASDGRPRQRRSIELQKAIEAHQDGVPFIVELEYSEMIDYRNFYQRVRNAAKRCDCKVSCRIEPVTHKFATLTVKG